MSCLAMLRLYNQLFATQMELESFREEADHISHDLCDVSRRLKTLKLGEDKYLRQRVLFSMLRMTLVKELWEISVGVWHLKRERKVLVEAIKDMGGWVLVYSPKFDT